MVEKGREMSCVTHKTFNKGLTKLYAWGLLFLFFLAAALVDDHLLQNTFINSIIIYKNHLINLYNSCLIIDHGGCLSAKQQRQQKTVEFERIYPLISYNPYFLNEKVTQELFIFIHNKIFVSRESERGKPDLNLQRSQYSQEQFIFCTITLNMPHPTAIDGNKKS